ncbi:MAG: hypothetical protein K0S12_2258, partial [Bacteroidetes bacterium]|nr:hypothetical protein [Bacteroidota bacterium]
MKKRCHICLSGILSLFTCLLFPQNIDSLKLVLKNAKHDTIRCTVLSMLAETAPEGEWENYNAELKVLAEKKVASSSGRLKKIYLRHLATALNNIGYIYNS